MAKNKKEKFNSKNIKINEEELSITKIGEMETIEQSPLFILLLFGILLVFIFFLPSVVNLIKGSDEKPDYSLNETQKENKPTENPDNPAENIYYKFADSLKISLEENIEINEFALNGNELSFHVINKGENRFQFSKDNYFLELYTEEDTLLERVLLGEEIVSKGANVLFPISLSENSARNLKKLIFVKKDIADYPNVVLEKNQNEEEILTCTKETEIITYKFQNEKLFSIMDVANYSANISNYSTLFENWKNFSEKMNNLEGITSLFVDAGSGFVVNTTINTKLAKVEQTDNKNYYPNETLAKVVKFEMDARGFRCK